MNRADRTRQILLVRHGRSALPWDGRRLTAREFRARAESYQQHGIAADSVPSDSLAADARAAMLVVSSDLPRGLESAQRLVGGREIITSALLREAGAALPWDFADVRLSTPVWDWGFYYLWRCGVPSVGESARIARLRAKEACAWLESLALERSPALVVAHWTINRLLVTELRRRRWRGPRRPAGENWGATRYVRDGD